MIISSFTVTRNKAAIGFVKVKNNNSDNVDKVNKEVA